MGILIQLLVDWLTGDMLVFWTGLYAVAATLTLVVLAVAAWIALRQTGELVHSRDAALLTDLSVRWDERLLVESRQMTARFDDGERLRLYFEAEWHKQSYEIFVLQRIPNFFEDLSVLEWSGAIQFPMIRESFGRLIWDTWKKWKPSVDYRREQENDNAIYERFQGLAERMARELGIRDDADTDQT